MRQWSDKTAIDLIGFIRATMPPGANGSLADQTYINLRCVHPGRQQRIQPGDQTLPLRNQGVSDLAASRQGERAAYLQPGAAPAPIALALARSLRQAGSPGSADGAWKSPVSGEVKNYVPVTNAAPCCVIQIPAIGSLIRRDYKATYYSPLNQITPRKTSERSASGVELGLVHGKARATGLQPAPIVHNGRTVCVNNAGMVLQALDAKTGELIRENRYGSDPTAPAMRGITIYDDKIFCSNGRGASVGLAMLVTARWSGILPSAIAPKATTATAAVHSR